MRASNTIADCPLALFAPTRLFPLTSWRAADERCFRMLEARFKGAVTIHLNQSYRCTQKILCASEAVLCNREGEEVGFLSPCLSIKSATPLLFRLIANVSCVRSSFFSHPPVPAANFIVTPSPHRRGISSRIISQDQAHALCLPRWAASKVSFAALLCCRAHNTHTILRPRNWRLFILCGRSTAFARCLSVSVDDFLLLL